MASTDALALPLKNTAYRVYFAIYSSTGGLVSGWTGAAATRSLDGATAGATTNTPTEIATNSGMGYLDLTAAEMNTNCTIISITVTNTNAQPTVIPLYPATDAMLHVNVMDWNSAAVAAPNVPGVPKVDLVDWLGSAPNALVNGGVPTPDVLDSGTLQSVVDATHVTLRAALNIYDLAGSLLVILSGSTNAPYQSAIITNWNNTTKVATFAPAFTASPTGTVTYMVLSRGRAAVDLWHMGEVPAPNQNGVPIVDTTYIRGTQSPAQVGYVAPDWAQIANPTTAQDLSGTTIKNVDNAIANVTTVGSVTGAVGSVTGNVGGNVVGSVGSVVATVAANLTQILGTALTESVAGYLAAAFKKLFNVATPTLTAAGIDQTGDSYARLGAPAGASISADIAEIEAETDGIASIPTNPLLTNDVRLNDLDASISSRLPTSSYTAPDNADISAIKSQTDKFTFTGSDVNAAISGGSFPTPTAIAAAVWAYVISTPTTAADILLALYRRMLDAGAIVFQNPVDVAQTKVSIQVGATYYLSEGRELPFTAPAGVDLTGALVVYSATVNGNEMLPIDGVVRDSSHYYFELPLDADNVPLTNKFTEGPFLVVITLANGHPLWGAWGQQIVKRIRH